MDAVHAQCLLVGLGVVPVVEDAGAGAEVVAPLLNGDHVTPPRGAEIQPVVEVGLGLLSEADAQREALARAGCRPGRTRRLHMRVVDERVAGALRDVLGRPAS